MPGPTAGQREGRLRARAGQGAGRLTNLRGTHPKRGKGTLPWGSVSTPAWVSTPLGTAPSTGVSFRSRRRLLRRLRYFSLTHFPTTCVRCCHSTVLPALPASSRCEATNATGPAAAALLQAAACQTGPAEAEGQELSAAGCPAPAGPGPAPTPFRPGTRRRQEGPHGPAGPQHQHPRSAHRRGFRSCTVSMTLRGGGRSVSQSVRRPVSLSLTPPWQPAAPRHRFRPPPETSGERPPPPRPREGRGLASCPPPPEQRGVVWAGPAPPRGAWSGRGPASPGPGGSGGAMAAACSAIALRQAGNEEFRRGQYGPAAALYTRALALLEAAGTARPGPGGWRETGGRRLNTSPAGVPAQGRPPPRNGACCSPTAPPATSRKAPAASASPTAAGERRRGRRGPRARSLAFPPVRSGAGGEAGTVTAPGRPRPAPAAPSLRGLPPLRRPPACPPRADAAPGVSVRSVAAPWTWSPSGSSPSSGGPPPTRPWRGTSWPTWTTRPRCRWTAPYRRHTTVSTGEATACALGGS